MDESLLAHIAGNFVTQYENVANSSLCYLLNRYQSARNALQAVLSSENIPSSYMTEVSTVSNGRPDVTGFDKEGNKAVIIEGKFWAHLTDNQPANYLNELSNGGKILFLAPQRRLLSLQAQIRQRMGGDDPRIEVESWLAYIKLVEAENGKTYDADLAADLVQLHGLCSKMDQEGMPPLSMTDLDPMNGRICFQFSDLIDDCNFKIREWSESDFSGTRTTPSKDGYGFYFKAFGFGGYLCFSTEEWFTRKSHTPIWLHVFNEQFKRDERLYHVLHNYDADNTYRKTDRILYGIVLQPGMDRDQVIEVIVRKTRKVLSVLYEYGKTSSPEE